MKIFDGHPSTFILKEFVPRASTTIPFTYPIMTGGKGCFPPGSRFFASNFGSNNSTQSKLNDFPKI